MYLVPSTSKVQEEQTGAHQHMLSCCIWYKSVPQNKKKFPCPWVSLYKSQKVKTESEILDSFSP